MALPTSAKAASGPGQVISKDELLPGSVNDPCARKAPRHAASASQSEAETLERGYAIVRDISGQVISSALTANEKESLLIKFADGTTTVKPIN